MIIDGQHAFGYLIHYFRLSAQKQMQVNILWSGREYYSLENCLVSTTEVGLQIRSVIIGMYNDSIYKVEYVIRTTRKWETVSIELRSWNANKFRELKFENNGTGLWQNDGKELTAFKGCIDIDISVTPFTNTLPINRLQLQKNESQEIKVIHFDVFSDEIRSVTQRYTRLSERKYRFENVPNDFEADIEVDERGLVIDYPQLFVRSALVETNYL
jgi:hypothetical protein